MHVWIRSTAALQVPARWAPAGHLTCEQLLIQAPGRCSGTSNSKLDRVLLANPYITPCALPTPQKPQALFLARLRNITWRK